MIDLIVEVVGLLARALGRANGRERPDRLFRDFVEPIQQDLLRVHEDYLRSFSELADLIADESVPAPEIEATVRRQRRKFNPVRLSTAEIAGALGQLMEHRFGKKEPKEGSAEELLHSYTDAVIDYLYGGEPAIVSEQLAAGGGLTAETDPRLATRYTEFVRLAKTDVEGANWREQMARMVRETERDLDRSWRVLAHRYGKLKAECLA